MGGFHLVYVCLLGALLGRKLQHVCLHLQLSNLPGGWVWDVGQDLIDDGRDAA
jgi:hypothetical protein